MSIRLLENSSRRELENVAYDRLLENLVIAIYPDPFQATAAAKTQVYYEATAKIKSYDPFQATTKLHGTPV